MDASAVISAIESRYRTCSSYRDTGVSLASGTDSPAPAVEFATFFVNPEYFRFDWKRPHAALQGTVARHSIITNGQRHVLRSTRSADPEEKSFPSAELAVAGGTGTSRGACAWAHQLFFPARSLVRFRLLACLTGLAAEQALADGTVCHVLRGQQGAPWPVEVWAEVAQHAIRKIITGSGTDLHEISIQQLSFDQAMDAALFEI